MTAEKQQPALLPGVMTGLAPAILGGIGGHGILQPVEPDLPAGTTAHQEDGSTVWSLEDGTTELTTEG